MRTTLIKCIKFYPIIINLYILLIMCMSILGIRVSLYELFGQSYMLNFLLLISSIVFSFCYWHRILIFSMTLILFLENLYNLGIRVSYYPYLCILIVLLSIILSSILYYKNGCYCEKKFKGEVD